MKEVAAYEFGEFLLDLKNHLLARSDGTPVPLTPRVFDTLVVLVENHGTVLDKARLMEAVWPESVVEENNLNQNISTLRRVLGDTPELHRFIVTVPGRGYRFAAAVKTASALTNKALPPPRKTVAVLPFRPLVPESGDVSLEMGMADTLIARLSNIRELVVRPLSAVRRYVDLEQEPLVAGQELGVDSILEGNIQRNGDSVRVNVRLLKVIDGSSLWAGTFDEKFIDIFSVQNAIAERVVGALALRLSREEEARLTRQETDNAEAYHLYLKGRYYWWKTTPEGFQKCRDYFQQAVDADPTYALGYCGLNAFFGYGSAFGMLPPDEGWPRAAKAAEKALELDNTLAQGYSDLGAHQMVYHRDWVAAEEKIKYAIELKPQVEEVHYLYSFFLITRGRFEEAIAEAKLALELDPLSLRLHQHLGATFYYARRYNEAIDRYRQTLQLDPDHASVHEALGDAFEQKGLLAEAISEWEEAMILAGDKELATVLREPNARSSFAAAMRAVAQKKLERLRERQEAGGYIPAIEFVRAYLRLGDKEQAFAVLARAAEERNVFALLLRCDPFYDGLRKDRRFTALLERNGLL